MPAQVQSCPGKMFLHADLVQGSQKTIFSRLARTCSAYPRLSFSCSKAWMAGTRPAKTKLGARCSSLRRCEIFPGQPFALLGVYTCGSGSATHGSIYR